MVILVELIYSWCITMARQSWILGVIMCLFFCSVFTPKGDLDHHWDFLLSTMLRLCYLQDLGSCLNVHHIFPAVCDGLATCGHNIWAIVHVLVYMMIPIFSLIIIKHP